MKDRVKIANGKSSKLMCPSGYNPADFSAFLADLKSGAVYVDITPNNATSGSDQGVTEVGTALNKANILSDATAEKYGYSASTDDPTPNDVFDTLAEITMTLEEITLSSSGWTENSSGIYEQTVNLTVLTDLTADDKPYVEDIIPSSVTKQTLASYQYNQSLVTKFACGNGSITAYAYSSAPTINLVFGVRGR